MGLTLGVRIGERVRIKNEETGEYGWIEVHRLNGPGQIRISFDFPKQFKILRKGLIEREERKDASKEEPSS